MSVTITPLYRPGGVSKCRSIPYGDEVERCMEIAFESMRIEQGGFNRSSSDATWHTCIDFVKYLFDSEGYIPGYICSHVN